MFFNKFTPTPYIDLTKLVDLKITKDKSFIVDYKDEEDIQIDEELLKRYPDTKIDWEKSKEIHDRKKNWRVPNDVKKEVQKYNRWVEEVRFNSIQWKPKKPQHGRKTPFFGGPIYKDFSVENREKYPELKKIYEEHAKEGDVDENMMPAYYRNIKK